MIDFLKQHQSLMAWLLPIVVTFAGVWLGSRVQAGGGVAQAKAAKKQRKRLRQRPSKQSGNRPTTPHPQPTPLLCVSSGSAQRRTCLTTGR